MKKKNDLTGILAVLLVFGMILGQAGCSTEAESSGNGNGTNSARTEGIYVGIIEFSKNCNFWRTTA